MKTLTKTFVKRSISILLVLMMVFSLLTVGLTSASAAEVEIAQTGATLTVGKIFYLKPNTNWQDANAWFAMYIWKDTSTNTWVKMERVDDPDNVVYKATIPSGTWNNLAFVRMNPASTALDWNNKWDQSADLTWDGTSNNCWAPNAGEWNNAKGSWSAYEETPAFSGELWADIDGDPATSGVNDRVYMEVNKAHNNTYMLYLPSGIDSSKLLLKTSEGSNFSVDNNAITTSGTEFNATAKIMNDNSSFSLSGDISGTLYIRQSTNTSSLHTITEDNVPMEESMNQLADKDKYNSENDSDGTGVDTQFIVFRGTDNSVKYNDVLGKIKGRGNSSWDASNRVFGKYAFNITLGSKTDLLGSGVSKKYCLVSYNADEARMRNMIAYELSNEIGLEFSPKFEPVDFYNNGRYIGSYLLTDKVEIGSDESPLVNITDLEKANKKVEANKAIFDNETFTKTTSGTKGQPGYKMYAGNLTDPGQSQYNESGFLLELELDERFDSEFSGFISRNGQEIVCKYP